MRFRLDIHWTACLLSVKGSENTFKVYPVNSPWTRFVGSIGMRNSRRKDKILVGGYRIFLFADAVPSGPVYAIDEYILVDRLFPFPEVMLGFRIISDVSNV